MPPYRQHRCRREIDNLMLSDERQDGITLRVSRFAPRLCVGTGSAQNNTKYRSLIGCVKPFLRSRSKNSPKNSPGRGACFSSPILGTERMTLPTRVSDNPQREPFRQLLQLHKQPKIGLTRLICLHRTICQLSKRAKRASTPL